MASLNVISKYNGDYIIEESLKVTKTVLEDFWSETSELLNISTTWLTIEKFNEVS